MISRRKHLLALMLMLVLVLAVSTSACGSPDRPLASAAPITTPTATATATSTATPSPTPAQLAEPPIKPNPIISRGQEVRASFGMEDTGAVVDGKYCTWPAWRSGDFPSWLAIKLDKGPSRLLFVWNSDYTFDYIGDGSRETYGIPADYTIETSADSTNGEDGSWTVVADVHGNFARQRQHSFAFDGDSWVKMTVNSLVPKTASGLLAIDEIDIFDISAGASDTVFFMGDSITSIAFARCDTPLTSFAEDVHRAYPNHFPAMIDGGVGGVTAAYGAQVVDQYLRDNPDFHYWAIGYGTNDAWQNVAPDVFERNMQTIIDRVKAAGRVPILARIPYSRPGDGGPDDASIQALNRVIDRLTRCNNLMPGPDLYSWFKAHPNQLGSDGVHPNTAGTVSINRLWFETMRHLYDS